MVGPFWQRQAISGSRGRRHPGRAIRLCKHLEMVILHPGAATGEPSGYFVVKSGAHRFLVDEAPWWLRSWMNVYRRAHRHPRLQGIVPRPFRTFVDRDLVESRWTSDHPGSLSIQRYPELAVRTDLEVCWRFLRKHDDEAGSDDVGGCPNDATWRGEIRIGERRQVVDSCEDHLSGLGNLRRII